MHVWYADILFAHQPKDLGAQKLGKHGWGLKFLGYPPDSAGYRVYNPSTHKVEVVCAPTFCEEGLPLHTAVSDSVGDELDDDGEVPMELARPSEKETDVPAHDTDATPTSAPAPPAPPMPHDLPSSSPSQSLAAHPLNCPQRERHAPCCFNPDDFGAHGHHMDSISNAYKDLKNESAIVNMAELHEYLLGLMMDTAHLADNTIKGDISLPNSPSLCEVLAGPKQDAWHAAILEEFAAIKDVGTWSLVDHTPDIQNIVGCHFILQKKCGSDGEVTHFKARLVVQGFSQREGIDYSETFAPVIKAASL